MLWISCYAAILIGTLGQTGPSTVKAAVINLPEISSRYQKTADLEVQFEALRQQLNGQRDTLNERVERLRRSLQEELRPGTEAFEQRRKELAMAQAELEWFLEFEGQRVEQGLAQALRGIYADIQSAVREVAQEMGLDMVLAVDQMPDAVPESSNQVRQQILMQKVIYWHPRLDITEDVIARLNTRYRAKNPDPADGSGGSGGAGTPRPEPDAADAESSGGRLPAPLP